MSDPELVELAINGRAVKAEKDRLLIDVAEELGIFVPRFCYHPGMKSVAVCRMCLVQVEGQGKLVPACATPVADGMKVNTAGPEAAGAQEDMLEFLLINHPLDCPICDRGGECPLQDQTYRHGPGSSRYVEEKRTYEKALEISNLVVLDRERCVLCWRCVRFSDEIAGDRFIQLVDRGDGTQILNFHDDPFDSYFSGNTIQICPVGALTSKPYRFVSRPWDLETAPSVCNYCSVGCPITNEARQDVMVRCQALPNERVNDFWICDKGRFGYHHVDAKDRLQTPLVRVSGDEFTPASWGTAVDKIAEAVRDKENVAVIAGGHLATEDAYAISKLARGVLKTNDIDSRIQDAGAPYELALEFSPVAGSTATLEDLRAARTIVWAGADPKETVPVVYLHLHTSFRERDAKIVVLSPRGTSLDTFAKVIRTGPTVDGLNELTGELGDGPTVFCWSPASFARDESSFVRAYFEAASRAGAKLLICPPHAGSQGMIDMGVHPALEAGYRPVDSPGKDSRAILEAAAAGELDALLIFGADPIADFPDAGLARRALESSTFTVVMELFPTETALLADVVLPSTAYAEREGTFTNLERRLQKLEKLVRAPGASLEPWKACVQIAKALNADWRWKDCADLWDDLRSNVPTHKDVALGRLSQEPPAPQVFYSSGFAPERASEPLQLAGPGGQYPKGHRAGAPFQTGQNWPLSWELRAFEAKQRPGHIPAVTAAGVEHTPAPASRPSGSPASSPQGSEDGRFVLYTQRMIYDEGSMISRTAALRAIQAKPFVEINDEDAKRLGVADGDEVVVEGAETSVTVPARVNGIARGSVFMPYDQQGVKVAALISGIDPTVVVRKP
ncbi:MAG: NADH-quinone oxidoreductase subunit NuoG [Actinomycetota bacterium]